MRSGVPILNVLDLTAQGVGNKVIAVTINSIKESVNEGKGMALPMKNSGMFPPVVIQMVSVGEQIGKGRKLDDVIREMNMIAEGVHTSKAVAELSGRLGVEMPITRAVYEMLFEGKPAQQAMLELMTREPKSEND